MATSESRSKKGAGRSEKSPSRRDVQGVLRGAARLRNRWRSDERALKPGLRRIPSVVFSVWLLGCVFFAGASDAIAAKRTTKTFAAQTATGVTASLDLDKLRIAPVDATAQLNITGSPTTCTYQVEGSLDNVTWFDLSGGQTCTANLMFHLDSKPVNYIRGNLTALGGGTSPTVTFIYLGVSR